MNVSHLQGKSQAELLDIIAAMQARPAQRLTLKVSKSGAVSVYGMGRWPTTLYASQWDKVLDMGDDIRAFIAANRAMLSQGKDDPRFAKED